jgi:hypothetical protein
MRNVNAPLSCSNAYTATYTRLLLRYLEHNLTTKIAS